MINGPNLNFEHSIKLHFISAKFCKNTQNETFSGVQVPNKLGLLGLCS